MPAETKMTVSQQHAEKIDEIAYWAWQAGGHGLFDDAVRRAENDSATARQVTAARTAARSALLAAGRMPAWPEGEFERIAKSQAETLAEQATTIRALIRERDAAKDQAHGAYDLAERYARQLGVDITRHAVLKYVERHWEQQAKFDRDWQALEAVRATAAVVALQLERACKSGEVDDLSARVLAGRLIKILRSKPAIGEGPVRRSVALFARPPAPSRKALADRPSGGEGQ